MCARKSKTKKFSHQDCTTCHQSNDNIKSIRPNQHGSSVHHPGVNQYGSPNQYDSSIPDLQKADPACSPRVILCPKVLKVADKDVEVGERPSIHRDCKYDRKSEERVRGRVVEDSEELRRKAFEMYRQYLLQKRGNANITPVICPPEPVIRGSRYYQDQDQDDNCYDPTFNIFLVIVFLMLFVMLSITSGFIYVVYKTDSLRSIFHNYALYFVVPALFIIFLMNCTMACSQCSRVLPCNFLYLLFAVVCKCIVLSVITAVFNTTIVLLVYASTAIVVAFFIMLAYSPFDFTKWLLYVVAIILALLATWGLIVAFNKYLRTTYALDQSFLGIICTVMNVVILVIELQLLLSGRSIDLDESEYATGAYLLYTSILELFFNLVQATGVLEETDLKDDSRIC